VVRTGEIWLAQLDPTAGSEIQKTRPCVVVSPDDINTHLRTVIVAPMTTGSHPAGFRVAPRFQGKAGLIVLDQIRTLDKLRLVKRVGVLRAPTLATTLRTLQGMSTPTEGASISPLPAASPAPRTSPHSRHWPSRPGS
jgi:mRNA interferase MazF